MKPIEQESVPVEAPVKRDVYAQAQLHMKEPEYVRLEQLKKGSWFTLSPPAGGIVAKDLMLLICIDAPVDNVVSLFGDKRSLPGSTCVYPREVTVTVRP